LKKIVVSGGKAALVDDRAPTLADGNKHRVLVRVRYSAISQGTELGLIHNPQVPDGFQLGYSASGQVIETGYAVRSVRPGDWVAVYGGPYVHHAETLSVPEQLVVRLESDRFLKEAAFVGLGSVAVHSVRRMRLQFGETVWVVGLGLLGLLIAQLCRNANYRVFATDMNPKRVELARKVGIDHAYAANDEKLAEAIGLFTDGYGFDAIALCAHSNHSAIIEQTMTHLAFRGRYTLVGNVPIAFPRELFFQKEADFLIARAAGPGRYDPLYENECIDYPRSYVRWTEGRNMKEFIRQVETGLLDLGQLITHEYDLSMAEEAYTMLEHDAESALGVLLRYEAEDVRLDKMGRGIT
jgi:2-desacetyl-2-hydroxyethyl bacteriochlorophyllide A dehydrogenase